MFRFCFFLLLFLDLSAKDFSVRAQVFDIQEENLLEILRKKKFDEDFLKEKMKAAFREPKAIELPLAKEARSFLYDTRCSFGEDILSEDGNVILAKGDSFNPLDNLSLHEKLLFFDARNERELIWALEQENSIWVLVGGSPLDLQEQYQRPVFFDQMGVLVEKLKIEARPAKVFQEGKALRVVECPL